MISFPIIPCRPLFLALLSFSLCMPRPFIQFDVVRFISSSVTNCDVYVVYPLLFFDNLFIYLSCIYLSMICFKAYLFLFCKLIYLLLSFSKRRQHKFEVDFARQIKKKNCGIENKLKMLLRETWRKFKWTESTAMRELVVKFFILYLLDI